MTATHTMPAEQLAADFVTFLETGVVPEGLFAPDIFGDISLPTWRVQATDREGLLAIRRDGHAARGRVPRHRFDPTPTGFVLEFEEEWYDGGQRWYCREMVRADVGPGGIERLAIYCTGDWDEARQAEHARAVTLVEP